MNKITQRAERQSRTKLTTEQLDRVQAEVAAYLKTHDYVTNRVLRAQTDISYDQAIYFFGQMLQRRFLKKIGRSSATRCVLRQG